MNLENLDCRISLVSLLTLIKLIFIEFSQIYKILSMGDLTGEE